MPAPDARTRNKISLSGSKILSTSIPTRFIPQIFLSNLLYVLALQGSKEWILAYDIGVFWLVMRVLACGGLGVLAWEVITGQFKKRGTIEWSVLGTSSLLLFLQQASLFTALFRLPSSRVILFTHFSSLWVSSLVSFSSPRKSLAVAAAITLSIASDAGFSPTNSMRLAPGYAALLLNGLTSVGLEHTIGVLSPSLGSTFTIAATTLGASVFALPFYTFRNIVLNFPTSPILPLGSLVVIPLVAYSTLFLSPLTARSMSHLSFTRNHFLLSFPTLVILSGAIGVLAFTQLPAWADIPVACLLYSGMYPDPIDTFSGPPRTPASRLIKAYLKTILSNPESRKIFYFLMLNMSYMMVQMLYGVWTNSLGLISDAIHMAFDCMAIGVGLFASVMATWDPNEQFTYGYGRIETLSGFANGIFLILISIFIVFEAIQRLLEPPEMNTSQLLLVSSLGLAVNLFGMFAMGGHHHHGGHSHSHGHSHSAHSGSDHALDHGHSHAPTIPKDAPAHSHSPPTITHSHSHSPPTITRSHSHSPPTMTHSHSHSHSSLPDAQPKTHTHSHTPEAQNGAVSLHSHSHSPEDCDHSSHDEHTSHSHSHSPSPPSSQPSLGHKSKRHFHGPDIMTHASSDHINGSILSPPLVVPAHDVPTPLTPNYKFGHDAHFDTHHEAEHIPNLHNHSHAAHAHEGHSHNMRGVFLHVMADTLGSVGVIISTLLIQFYGWTGFDPIASLFIAILIAASVVPLVVDTGKVLCLDISDRKVAIEQALYELSSIEGLASYSEPRFWPKDSTSVIGSIHIQLALSASSHDPGGPHSNQSPTYANLDRVIDRVDRLLRDRISGLEELTIQVEPGRTSHDNS